MSISFPFAASRRESGLFVFPLRRDSVRAADVPLVKTNDKRMEQLNRIELRGTVGSVRLQTYDDNVVARMSVATNVAYRDKDGSAVIETTWHNVSAWEGKEIRNLEKIEKGTKVYVQGRLRNTRFVGQDGIEHYSTDIQAYRIVIIESNEPLQYEM